MAMNSQMRRLSKVSSGDTATMRATNGTTHMRYWDENTLPLETTECTSVPSAIEKKEPFITPTTS